MARTGRMLRIYPTRELAPLGKRRWEVEWQELTKKARERYNADRENYEHDRDMDEVNVVEYFETKEEAAAFALQKAQSGTTVYGACTYVEQEVVLMDTDDKYPDVGEWENIGEVEYAP